MLMYEGPHFISPGWRDQRECANKMPTGESREVLGELQSIGALAALIALARTYNLPSPSLGRTDFIRQKRLCPSNENPFCYLMIFLWEEFLYLIDHGHVDGRFRNFTQGGTLKNVVRDKQYITTRLFVSWNGAF